MPDDSRGAQLIGRFGQLVDDQIEKNPLRARRMLLPRSRRSACARACCHTASSFPPAGLTTA
jgi:hypothetical protein